MDNDVRPVIIGFVNNLMFSSKIEKIAERLGFQMNWVTDAKELDRFEFADNISARQIGEPLAGRGIALIEIVTRIRPALIIFDLGNDQIPWRSWLPMLKSLPSTKRLPVICFGAHVDTISLTAAQEFGADRVYARSRFMSGMTEIILKFANLPDTAGLNLACSETLSLHAINGLELYNAGEYFEAHEELEFAWNEDRTLGRDLYRAILQIAVAYLHIERQNFKGAYKMFLRARQWLGPMPDTCRGINIGKLRADADQVYKELVDLGPDRIKDFNLALLRKVEYTV